MTITLGTYYPEMPPREDGEGNADYTNRVLGCGDSTAPYNHNRNRQCSIGYHAECSQRTSRPNLGGLTTLGATGQCECPHHTDPRLEAAFPHMLAYLRVATGNESYRFVEAVDVLIDAMADMDKPLRALVQSWREVGGEAETRCAAELTAILEGNM